MPRRRATKQREHLGDPKYNDIVVARFVSYVMRRGKRSLAERIVYDCFDIIEKKTAVSAQRQESAPYSQTRRNAIWRR
jgi:small subunit ribosomal protein S7